MSKFYIPITIISLIGSLYHFLLLGLLSSATYSNLNKIYEDLEVDRLQEIQDNILQVRYHLLFSSMILATMGLISLISFFINRNTQSKQ